MENMIEIIKKYWLIIIIVGVVLIGIITLMLGSKKNTNVNTEQKQVTGILPTIDRTNPTPLPLANNGVGPKNTAAEMALQKKELEQNKNDYPLASILPYKTDLFTIDHYRGARKLVIIIKKDTDKSTATEGIKTWLQSKGFGPTSHEFIFSIQY